MVFSEVIWVFKGLFSDNFDGKECKLIRIDKFKLVCCFFLD